MAIVSKFYDGPVTESDWAKNRMGSPFYGVNTSDSWNVSATTGDRTISIAVGDGFGHGVADVSDTNVTLQLDPITSGSRWDLIAMRRDWQPVAGGPSAFVKVTGQASKIIPAGRLNNPGVQDDQPLALVQVTAGQTQPTAIVDLRCWAGPGGLEARDDLARSYLAYPGAEVRIGQAVWRYTAQPNNLWAWVPDYGIQVDGVPSGNQPIIKQGKAFLRNPENTANTTNAFGDGYIYFDTPFPAVMTSCVVMTANDPRSWDAVSEKFTLNFNDIYANRFRLSVRVSNKDGAAVGNRTGIRVTYIATGY